MQHRHPVRRHHILGRGNRTVGLGRRFTVVGTTTTTGITITGVTTRTKTTVTHTITQVTTAMHSTHRIRPRQPQQRLPNKTT